MSGFLDKMARSSRKRVEEALTLESLASVRVRALATPVASPVARSDSFGLIAEYKRRSPAGGVFAGDRDAANAAAAYASAGAAVVSVLTEPTQFNGEIRHLAEAAAALTMSGVPALRKDFLVDPYQLYEARAAGAGGVLLIVRLLSDAQLGEMLDCARELQLFVLAEVFDPKDIARAESGVRRLIVRDRRAPIFIGVNSRDLQTLEVVPGRFRELAPYLPADLPRVAESGILTPEDCADVARSGYGLALVGSALMGASDPGAVIRTMLAAARAVGRAAA